MSSPCLNGATCLEHQDSSGFACVCPPGYEGNLCEIDINFCIPDPCLNGATCVDMPDGFECQCPPGYEGDMCETDINFCDPDPCLNGATCVDLVEGYECQCPPGWEGTNCEIGMYNMIPCLTSLGIWAALLCFSTFIIFLLIVIKNTLLLTSLKSCILGDIYQFLDMN